MKTIIKKIQAFFILLHADYQLRQAIKEADKKYQRFNKRFYVIPTRNHKLISKSYGDIKKMRKAGIFSNHATEKSFILESFYYTPSRFGQHLTKEQQKKKRKSWLNYVAQAKHLI